MTNGTDSTLDGIAIIGLAGRFPGARNISQFWQNLAGGVESIRFFSDDDFRRAGLDPAALAKDADFVRARSVLDDVDLFDASFFGIDAREADLMDPIPTCWRIFARTGSTSRTSSARISSASSRRSSGTTRISLRQGSRTN